MKINNLTKNRFIVHGGIRIQESDYPFLMEVSKIVQRILVEKEKVFIVITGRPGCGKSTLAKLIRKRGFGNFHPKEIAVIDDDVMSREYLFGLVRTKLRINCQTCDNLEPFFRYFPAYKKIFIYVNTLPYKRMSRTDILVELHLNEKDRINRLTKRVKDLSLREYLIEAKVDIGELEYDYKIDAEVK